MKALIEIGIHLQITKEGMDNKETCMENIQSQLVLASTVFVCFSVIVVFPCNEKLFPDVLGHLYMV